MVMVLESYYTTKGMPGSLSPLNQKEQYVLFFHMFGFNTIAVQLRTMIIKGNI
jgi:hypothetical protein